jgi:hypothetical protein
MKISKHQKNSCYVAASESLWHTSLQQTVTYVAAAKFIKLHHCCTTLLEFLVSMVSFLPKLS